MPQDIFRQKTPREQAGAEAFRAFDFQVHVSMARILEAHSAGEKFSAYFDFFDDLILLEEIGGHLALSFYQVKVRTTSVWTPNRLASRSSKGDLPRSIIGKSYSNLHQFGALTRKAAIISNQILSANYHDGSSTTINDGEILLSKLCTKDHGALLAAIKLDFPEGLDARHEDVLTFQRIPLDVQSFRKTLLGLVTEFVSQIGPEYAVTAKPVYDALLSEITRCTGAVANPKTVRELRRLKSLGSDDIDALLGEIRRRSRTPKEWWQAVASELSAIGHKTIPIRKLELQCLEYWRARERGSAAALEIMNALRSLMENQPDLIDETVLGSLTAYKLACTLPEPASQPYTLKAALIVEIMEFLG